MREAFEHPSAAGAVGQLDPLLDQLDQKQIIELASLALKLLRDLGGEAGVSVYEALHDLLHLKVYSASNSRDSLADLRLARFSEALDYNARHELNV